ncbi:MAG: flagellar M-ring protein FliF [Syntrophothermus sp.]|uniref:flagellar basal-body MS-ring/collar protein FliF n=1 Tax=Syntrophothermus sp. TaxID=2736299 RepID=UPI002579797F|nr:flagellar basal-body MS-ring/collar protein FliF [Syntrophothermus sp.]NSW82406.1 flagellar M-ring protein FliF [Syntrophothermus sp.]
MNSFWERVQHWLQLAKNRWSLLTLNQKVLISGAVLLTLVSLGMLLSSQTAKNYEPLYSGLSVEDAAAITKKLDELKISYRLSDEGSTILVPSEQKYQVRLQLAGEGLPKGTAGFELFQSTSFGETETDKRVKYLTALQGELVRTIESLDKIESARVHLVLPEPRLYVDQEAPATASVVLKVKIGEELTNREISGIVHLVANSVEKLKPENVVVVDQYGNLLSADIPSADSMASAELSVQQMAVKRQLEREKQQAVQSMLDATLGPGKSVVRVNAELNFDEVEQYSQDFDPEQRVVVSKHTVEESSTSSNTGAAASPGVDTNVPTYQGTEGQGTSSSTSEKTEQTVNYEGDKVETKTKVAPGAIKRMTVAVLVDEGFESKREEIVEAVKNAVGADEKRNDSVYVSFMKFQTPTEETAPPASTWQKYMLPAGLGAALVIAVLLFWLARRRKAQEQEGFEALVDEEIPIESLVERELTPEEREKLKIREEIDKLIDENPADVAQIIRTWLLEEKR